MIPDWLAETFARAEHDYAQLPEWARPVMTPHIPPMLAAASSPAAAGAGCSPAPGSPGPGFVSGPGPIVSASAGSVPPAKGPGAEFTPGPLPHAGAGSGSGNAPVSRAGTGDARGTGFHPRTWMLELPAGLKMLSLNSRAHWSVRGRITRDIRKAAWALAKAQKIPHLDRASITVEYRPPQVTRRRDNDNIPAASGKPAIDGIVDAHILDDDSPSYVTCISYRIGEPFPQGRLVIYVTEVTE